MNFKLLEKEDRLALAETYRVYELLAPEEREQIPDEFVQMLINYGDLSLVPRLDPTKSLKDFNLSKRGQYLVLYMCTL